jgi:hypothetical protein
MESSRPILRFWILRDKIYFQGVLNGTSMEIPIDMLPNGTYFLQVVTTDEQVITKNFVKQ